MKLKDSPPPLPATWRSFVHEYGQNLAYWYQPKGLAVTTESVVSRLRVLKEFEATLPWGQCQAEYVSRLNEEGISEAEGKPLARMLKQVMAVLGLAWVDLEDQVEITPAGEELLNSNDPAAVLAKQSLRYQFWNPAVKSRLHQSVRLHPVPFLARLLQALDGRLTAAEYTLFVAKARAISDVDKVADQIDSFRKIDEKLQQQVTVKCGEYAIGGPKRSSILKTIQLNRSYAIKMWQLSGLFDINNGTITLRKNALRGAVRSFLDDYWVNGTYIDFSTEKNFLSWMGDASLRPTNTVALDIYTAQGDLASAAKIKKRLGATPAEVREFTKMLISEKTLEDNIVADFPAFAKGIKRNVEFVGRQYATTVGPIDILARDRHDGGYVVIELKKGRSADKVFGQLSRYMGWVRRNLANGSAVSGVIVGSQIDEKLSVRPATS